MSEVELYPNERNLIVSEWATLQRKYGQMESNKQNLVALAEETENRFKELGFRVIVDISNVEMTEQGEMFISPIISIEDRIAPETYGHDHERHAVEVQDGLYDGVQGSVTPDGQLKQRKIIVPR